MKKLALKYYVILSVFFLLAGCSDSPFASKATVALTFWHVYGGQSNSPMNALVNRFNQTVGREQGIVVNVTLLSNSADIHFALVAAANKHPGAGELPDMFTTYPTTVLTIGPDKLVDWKDYFSKEALAEFVPTFLAEGEIGERLLLLPVAKSSSALFINATVFEQFSQATGIGYEDLKTWEGMFRAAKEFYQWSGGKAFYKYDDWMHYSMMNSIALGGEFFQNNKINFQDSQFRKVWCQLARSAISGEVCLLNGYATTAMITGEVLCGIESTASVLYYKDKITFPDNTSIPLRLKILPVPCFEGGKLLAVQRGGGLGLIKSSPEKERAATVFAKWLTDVENNVPFVMETGYFPVKEEAYQRFLEDRNIGFQGEKYRELYSAVLKIHADYQFYVPPFFDGYGEIEKAFAEAQLELFRKYQGRVSPSDSFMRQLLSELELNVQ